MHVSVTMTNTPLSSGAASASLAPMVFPGQAALHPAILQFLFGQLGQAQQPQGPSQGAPQGLSQGAPSQGAPQGQQLAQPVPLSLPFIPPIYQAFMQVSDMQSPHHSCNHLLPLQQ